MPALKNSRHEAMCRHVVFDGMTIGQAYEAAGFARNRSNASRTGKIPAIRKRIAELKANVAEKAEWKAADRLKLLSDVAEKHKRKDARVTIAAVAEANKMQGSYAPTRNEHSGPGGGPIEYANLTEDEIDARIAALTSGVGKAEPGGEA